MVFDNVIKNHREPIIVKLGVLFLTSTLGVQTNTKPNISDTFRGQFLQLNDLFSCP